MKDVTRQAWMRFPPNFYTFSTLSAEYNGPLERLPLNMTGIMHAFVMLKSDNGMNVRCSRGPEDWRTEIAS